MAQKSAAIGLVAAALSLVFPPPSAASCSDRPGTPDNVSIQAISNTSVRFNWRITTRRDEVERFYDLQLYEEVPPTPASNVPTKKLIKNLSGVRGQGPYYLTRGGIDHYDFTGLKPGTKYCAWVMARTERGTEGCTSAIWSAQPCTTTEEEPKPKPITGIGKLKAPAISVQWLKGDVFLVRGANFTPNAPVTIEVSGQPTTLKSITVDGNNSPIVADKNASLYAMLGRVCNSGRSGTVAFVAQDKRRGLTTKPVTADCRSGAEYVPNRKIKP